MSLRSRKISRESYNSHVNELNRQILVLTAELKDKNRQLDMAAGMINSMMNDLPINADAHNWLVRNGYRDFSYQGRIFDNNGRRIMNE